MASRYLSKILKAQVYDVARETPLEPMPLLAARLGNQVLLKREDLQPVFSFKLRGAYNRMKMLAEEQLAAGVIAASAGNHAQGVALSAQVMGIKARIVMPTTTPGIKVDAVRRYGARVVLHGDTYDDAYSEALRIAAAEGQVFIHPYDDVDVIAGQGTVAMEILRQHGADIDAVFVPVGGGGLIAGMSAYIKQLYPEIKVIGVEPDDAPCLHHALVAGKRVLLDQVGIFADGVAVRQVGKEPFRVARQCVDEVILVSTDEICAAIKDIFDDTRSIAEPAGALAVAGLKKYLDDRPCQGQTFVAIDSGANTNFDRLRHVAERAELGERREALLAVTIPEKAGSFLRFCRIIGKRGISEFNYRYADSQQAQVFVGVKLTQADEEKNALIERLRDKDYPVTDLSDNEIAKLHIRHMVGGHALSVSDERLFRFEFPERPGALLDFLSVIGKRWNISLFHYRNHGAASGRVLIAMQIPAGQEKALAEFLQTINYDFWEESGNPAYALFLAAGTGPKQ